MYAADPALKSRRLRGGADRGFALVVTLVVVALLTVIVTAFLTTATNDRTISRAYLNRLKAEQAAEAGLARAIATFRTPAPLTDFRYVIASDANGLQTLIPLDPTKSDGTLDRTKERLLATTSTTTTVPLTINPQVTKQIGLIPLLDQTNPLVPPVEVGRYGYFIDEANGKQNIQVAGESDRKSLDDLGQIAVVKVPTSGNPVPLGTSDLALLRTNRGTVFSPSTLNRLYPPGFFSPAADDYDFTTASPVTNLAPNGKSKVNLKKLKAYIDSLPLDQTRGNARSKVVDRLLTDAEQGSDWGGGNLAFLNNLPHYSTTQRKQIVANLMDYLDSDIVPTTDDIDKPTYLGVEGRADSSGLVTGHPYINYVGTGIVFNLSGAAGKVGDLNSTRVLVFLGIVNPWSKPTSDWSTFYIQPEIEIEITGSASGGNLGGNAQAYFKQTITSGDNGNNLTVYPQGSLPPNSGITFPGAASGNNYANFNDLVNGAGRQPAGMSFSGLGYKFKKLRLKYTTTGNQTSYIQVLDGLSSLPQTASPADIPLPRTAGSIVYKLTKDGGPSKADYHLKGDPRLNFLPAQWGLQTSADQGAKPPTPTGSWNILSLADAATSDFPSDFAAPALTDSTWYTNATFGKNFFVKSPNNSATLIESIGELGYIHTGIPWETLRFYVTDKAPATSDKAKDRLALAYVQTGTQPNAQIGTVAAAPGETAPATAIGTYNVGVNINTSKPGALAALFLGGTADTNASATARALGTEPDSDFSSLATGLTAATSNRPYALPGDFLAVEAVKAVTNKATDDFARETLIRRTANALTTQSTRFTIYVVGEAREKQAGKVSTTGRTTLRAEIELRTNSTGQPVPVVIGKSFQ